MSKLPKTQEELEYQMKEEGKAKLNRALAQAVKRKNLDNNRAFNKVVMQGVATHVGYVRTWLSNAKKGKAGHQMSLAKHVMGLQPEVLSYYTVRYVFNGVMLGQNLTTIQRELGTAILDEIKMTEFYKQNRGAYKWVERQIKERGINQRHYKRAFFNRVAKHKGIEYPQFPEGLRIQVGAALIELLSRTPLIEYRLYRVMGKTKKDIVVHQHVYKMIRKGNDRSMELAVVNQPMIERPLPWSDIKGGGYHTVPNVLVKNADQPYRKDHLALLKKADLSQVYKALNALDDTKFAINVRVLDVVKWAYEKNLVIGKLPPSEDPPLPDKPHDIATNEVARTNYRKQARAVHEKIAAYNSMRFSVSATLATADKFKDCAAIYFPNQLDFRGRIYDLPIVFHPQAADYGRALLMFAEGKKIEDDVALGWLMVHGANCWGYDKVTLEERIEWVRCNLEQVRDVANNPKSNLWWTDADKPFSFLAWAFDFIGVLDHGCPSHIRVAMDGSCNGLQHFSAMLRDPVGAKAVNLAPNPLPSDIYQMVADVVTKKLKATSGKEKLWAETFLHQVKVDRKLTKRSVMVMPYGGTMHSTLGYVEEEVRKRLDKDNPFGDDLKDALVMLSKMVYDATREVVQGGKVVMDWLQEIAGIAADYNVHLHWTLPHGFVARQQYVKFKQKKVETLMEKKQVRIQSTTYEPTDVINKQRSVNSISPNFVHSLDACALMMTVNKCVDLGVTSFHMVHDDYGTHAADTQVLWECLREAFVELYRDNDVLGNFRTEVLGQLPPEAQEKVPELPLVGSFDIEDVLESDFFFA